MGEQVHDEVHISERNDLGCLEILFGKSALSVWQMVLSLRKLTARRAWSTRCGFSWLMSWLPGPHTKIQVCLSPFHGMQALCFISDSREGWKHLLSSPKEDEYLSCQSVWGLQKSLVLFEEKVGIKGKKKNLYISSFAIENNFIISSFKHYHQSMGCKTMYKMYALSPLFSLIPLKHHTFLAVFFSFWRLPKSQWRRAG